VVQRQDHLRCAGCTAGHVAVGAALIPLRVRNLICTTVGAMLNSIKKKLGRGGASSSVAPTTSAPTPAVPSSDIALPKKERRCGACPLSHNCYRGVCRAFSASRARKMAVASRRCVLSADDVRNFTHAAAAGRRRSSIIRDERVASLKDLPQLKDAPVTKREVCAPPVVAAAWCALWVWCAAWSRTGVRARGAALRHTPSRACVVVPLRCLSSPRGVAAAADCGLG
jgi:hypothetical protein